MKCEYDRNLWAGVSVMSISLLCCVTVCVKTVRAAERTYQARGITYK